MDFSCIISRVNSLCEARGIDKRIYTKSGAGKDFVSNIKKGSIPSIEKVCAIADFLGCSVDYLLGRQSAEIPADCAELFAKYTLLDTVDKAKILERVDTLLENDKYKKYISKEA